MFRLKIDICFFRLYGVGLVSSWENCDQFLFWFFSLLGRLFHVRVPSVCLRFLFALVPVPLEMLPVVKNIFDYCLEVSIALNRKLTQYHLVHIVPQRVQSLLLRID